MQEGWEGTGENGSMPLCCTVVFWGPKVSVEELPFGGESADLPADVTTLSSVPFQTTSPTDPRNPGPCQVICLPFSALFQP